MKKLVIVVLFLAGAAIFVNDLGVYVDARRTLIEATREAAETAAGLRGSRNVVARAAADKALERGVEVYLYDQDTVRVKVWTRFPAEGSILYGPARAFIAGEPIDTTPMLEHYETRPIH